MFAVFNYLALFVEILCSILLIGVILIQRSKGQGAGAAFGGGGMGEAVFGSQMGNVLTKATVVLSFIFLINTTILAIMGSSQRGVKSVTDSISSTASAPAPLGVPGLSAPAPLPVAPAPVGSLDSGFGPVDFGTPIGGTDVPSGPAPLSAQGESVAPAAPTIPEPAAPVAPVETIQPIDIGEPVKAAPAE